MDEFDSIISLLAPIIEAKREAVISETIKPTDYNTEAVRERNRLLGVTVDVIAFEDISKEAEREQAEKNARDMEKIRTWVRGA
jgi:hypothetical protein